MTFRDFKFTDDIGLLPIVLYFIIFIIFFNIVNDF